ncbi:hypothetical protein AVEN_35307-1 [Araneus ventricosus]|uniref:Uncharacterized protein n=1 Tax=Araneus ventricosus TaxID=182803 RepID=A0A4Y2TGV3_ARAVE|nr:hypothetical protein AVEN_35307-1 [Araneus ventricosus]
MLHVDDYSEFFITTALYLEHLLTGMQDSISDDKGVIFLCMPWTRAMDEKFEMLLAVMKEIKAGHEEIKAGHEEMKAGQEEM